VGGGDESGDGHALRVRMLLVLLRGLVCVLLVLLFGSAGLGDMILVASGIDLAQGFCHGEGRSS
jgi:hypothetical protein